MLVGLEEETARKFQKNLIHYLKRHRRNTGESVSDMAKRFGYSVDHYKRFESKSVDNRFIKCLDFIAEVAKIQQMDVKQLINFISGSDIEEGRELFIWEKEVIDYLSRININKRRNFSSFINRCDQDKFETLLPLLEKIHDMDEEDYRSVLRIIERIPAKKGESH